MPGDFTVKSATANCGNSGLGAAAITEFKNSIKNNPGATPLDALIIHCQEARFADVQAELNHMAKGTNYIVTRIGGMGTVTAKSVRTTFEEAWNYLSQNKSGIVTFIIHKKTLYITEEPSIHARRDHSITGLSAFNKGGQISRIHLANSNRDTASIDLVSAHYDTFSVIKRSQDHLNVYQAHQKKINDIWLKLQKETKKSPFDCLAEAIPNQLLYGADTNVRNRYSVDNTTDIWQAEDAPELQLLKYLPLANKQYTALNTFHQANRRATPDNRRQGFKGETLATTGGLDLNAYMSSINDTCDASLAPERQNTSLINVEMANDEFPLKKKRDHVIIMSKQPITIPFNDANNDTLNFNKVKNYIAIRLQHIRPTLAKKIERLASNSVNKRYLLFIFEMYFSTSNGKIHQLAQQHQTYLTAIKKELDKEDNGQIKAAIFDNALNRTRALWLEPSSQFYKNLITDMNQPNIEEIFEYMKENVQYTDVISPYHIAYSTFEQLKKQVGNYTHSLEELQMPAMQYSPKKRLKKIKNEEKQALITQSLDKASQKALYQGLDDYQKKHTDDIRTFQGKHYKNIDNHPTFFRDRFINYLQDREFPNVSAEKERLRLSSPKKAATSMTALLGTNGVKLFIKALEEEANSKEFRDAIYFNSASFIPGDAWKQRPIHYIGGPSSTGKSYSAEQLMKYISSSLSFETNDESPGNLMIEADGGIVRKTSQMRKLMIQIATSYGFTGIDDLHSHCKSALSPIKHVVRNAAFASSKKVGVTIPETFTKHTIYGFRFEATQLEKSMIQASKLDGNTSKVFFSRTMPLIDESVTEIETEQMAYKSLVAYSGERRAFKSDGFNDTVIIDLNNTDIVESKKYEDNFDLSNVNSELMENWCLQHIPNSVVMHVMVDLILMSIEDGKTQPFRVSKRVINAWESLPNMQNVYNPLLPKAKNATRSHLMSDNLINYLYFGSDLKEGELETIDVSDKTLEELLNLYQFFQPDNHTSSLKGFDIFLSRLGKSPPIIVEDIHGKRLKAPPLKVSDDQFFYSFYNAIPTEQARIASDIYDRFFDENKIHQEQKNNAIKIINDHISSGFNKANHITFENLKKAIQKKGLSFNVINSVLNDHPLKPNSSSTFFSNSETELSYQCIYQLFEWLPEYKKNMFSKALNSRYLFEEKRKYLASSASRSQTIKDAFFYCLKDETIENSTALGRYFLGSLKDRLTAENQKTIDKKIALLKEKVANNKEPFRPPAGIKPSPQVIPVRKSSAIITTEKDAKKMVIELLGANIFNDDEFDINKISDAINQKEFKKKLNSISSMGSLFLTLDNAKKYKQNIEELIVFLNKENKRLISDLTALNDLLVKPDMNKHPNIIKSLTHKISALEIENNQFKSLIEDLKNLDNTFSHRIKASSKVILNQSMITTIMVKPSDLHEKLDANTPLKTTASLKGTPLKTLPPIPKGKVALHQFQHEGKTLSFVESQDHRELKAIRSKKRLDKKDKMALAFIMAQKFLINFEGKPSQSYPIYLKGKDLELIDMINGALHMLADKDVLNIDSNAIKIQIPHFKSRMNASNTDLKMVDTLKKHLDKDFLKEMLSLSKEVQDFKQKDADNEALKTLSDNIHKIHYQLTKP